MASEFKIIGKVGNIIEKSDCYLVNIADNKYRRNDEGQWVKDQTIWFNCLTDFRPKVKIGDTVMVEGFYLCSKSDKYDHVMKIKHLGVIKQNQDR